MNFNNIKKGDRLLCKKSYIISIDSSIGTLVYKVKKDEYYIVSKIIKVTSDVWGASIDDNLYIIDSKIDDAFKKFCEDERIPLISDYFYTNSELRKMKLNEIKRI